MMIVDRQGRPLPRRKTILVEPCFACARLTAVSADGYAYCNDQCRNRHRRVRGHKPERYR